MGWADNYIAKLQEGEEVSFRPRGNSMTPKIKSGQLVTVSPDLTLLKMGDVVLCKVSGKQYLHYVQGQKIICKRAIGETENQYCIENARGHVNGWTSTIYGRVTNIED